MNRRTIPLPSNRLASEIFLQDVFAEIRARLALLASIDIELLRGRGIESLAFAIDEIDDALEFHLANRTPWAHATDTTGADHD
ncbi:hypothetical protein [uncultured Thiodictyon sp.]|uniref:hypothetical protein n=1 Tax=uncultured Thiodictyon sp. TaxID=1846217 RepID=UPI0025F049AC|nr:hypothetical protein [uncultured Thiodictyon sp.]